MLKSVRRRSLCSLLLVAPTLALSVLAPSPANATVERAHNSAASGPLIGFMVPESTVPRFLTQDWPNFQKWMRKLYPSARLVVEDANGSPSQQLAQAQALLTRGVKAIVLDAVSDTASTAIVKDAYAAHVPVVNYNRLTADAPVSAYVGTDAQLVGVAMGKWLLARTKRGDTIAVINGSPTDPWARAEHAGFMSVLDPAFKSGARHMVGNVWTPGWLPTNATNEIEAILTKTHDNIQGLLAPNDGTAEGMIPALAAQGLAGKIPITGVDAGLTGDRLILKGLLGMSVWRSPIVEQHYVAMAVIALLTHKSLPKVFAAHYAYNGLRKVPWAVYPFYIITKSNMSLELSAGVLSKAQLCKGIPSGVGPC